MSEESTVAHGPEHGLERLIFFSDAVFAIAITLLVIDLKVPVIHFGSPDIVYWTALAELGPQFLGFFISFFVIGFFWSGHHRTMAAASHFDPRIYLPNLLLLSSVAAMPFFTAFASENPGMRIPVFVYCAWMLVTGLFNRLLQQVVLRVPIIDPAVNVDYVNRLKQRGTAVILGALTAMAMSLILPVLGQTMLVTIPLWRGVVRRVAARLPNRTG